VLESACSVKLAAVKRPASIGLLISSCFQLRTQNLVSLQTPQVLSKLPDDQLCAVMNVAGKWNY